MSTESEEMTKHTIAMFKDVEKMHKFCDLLSSQKEFNDYKCEYLEIVDNKFLVIATTYDAYYVEKIDAEEIVYICRYCEADDLEKLIKNNEALTDFFKL